MFDQFMFSAFLDSYFIKHLPHAFLDHAPLLLTVSSHNSHKKTFYFDNYWLEYIGCHSAIREAWDFIPHSNSMHAFFHLLTRARSKLLSWQASGLNSLETNINKLNLEILDVETNNGIRDTTNRDLTALYNHLSALHRQNSTK